MGRTKHKPNCKCIVCKSERDRVVSPVAFAEKTEDNPLSAPEKEEWKYSEEFYLQEKAKLGLPDLTREQFEEIESKRPSIEVVESYAEQAFVGDPYQVAGKDPTQEYLIVAPYDENIQQARSAGWTPCRHEEKGLTGTKLRVETPIQLSYHEQKKR